MTKRNREEEEEQTVLKSWQEDANETEISTEPLGDYRLWGADFTKRETIETDTSYIHIHALTHTHTHTHTLPQ